MNDVKSFSTKEHKPSRRLDAWNDWVASRFSNCVVDGRREFLATNKTMEFGNTSLSVVEGDGAHLSNVGNIRSRCSGEYRFLLVHSRNSVAKCGYKNGVEVVGDDSFVLIDLSQKMSYESPKDNKYLSMICLREEDMLSRNPAVEQSVGRKINLQVGSGSVLKCFIDNVWRGDGITPERGGRLLLDLVDLALYDAASTSTAHLTVRQRRLPDVIDFIKSNLEDPSLSTGTIANHFGLSERCVQLLFSDMQTTPSRYIRGLKLERVASLLLLSQYPITNLAYDFGFGDYSQFCRDFKLRFGLSPSNYRCKSA